MKLAILAAALSSVFIASVASAQEVKLHEPIFAELYRAAKAANETEVTYYTAARTEEAERLNALWSENFPDIQLTIVGKKAP